MNASRLLVLAVFTSACGGAAATDRPPTNATEAALQEGERKTSTDPGVNPDAAAMAEFKARVDVYADSTSGSPRATPSSGRTADPAQDQRRQGGAGRQGEAARAGAKQGDIFTPEVRPVFRRLLAPELKGEDGRDAKAVLKDDAPAPGTRSVQGQRAVSGEPAAADRAGQRPADAAVAARAAGIPHRRPALLLLDTAADLIVDYILNAITT